MLLVLSLQPVISDGLAGGHLGHLVTTCVLSVNAIEAQLHVSVLSAVVTSEHFCAYSAMSRQLQRLGSNY